MNYFPQLQVCLVKPKTVITSQKKSSSYKEGNVNPLLSIKKRLCNVSSLELIGKCLCLQRRLASKEPYSREKHGKRSKLPNNSLFYQVLCPPAGAPRLPGNGQLHSTRYEGNSKVEQEGDPNQQKKGLRYLNGLTGALCEGPLGSVSSSAWYPTPQHCSLIPGQGHELGLAPEHCWVWSPNQK